MTIQSSTASSTYGLDCLLGNSKLIFIAIQPKITTAEERICFKDTSITGKGRAGTRIWELNTFNTVSVPLPVFLFICLYPCLCPCHGICPCLCLHPCPSVCLVPVRLHVSFCSSLSVAFLLLLSSKFSRDSDCLLWIRCSFLDQMTGQRKRLHVICVCMLHVLHLFLWSRSVEEPSSSLAAFLHC